MLTPVRTDDRSAVSHRQDGHVRIITLDRPATRNALTPSDREHVLAALESAGADRATRVVLLRGHGSHFCAGGDISSMTDDRSESLRRLDVLAAIARTLIESTKPVVAAVEGCAFGMGLSLVAASDYVVAGQSARFGASFGRIGLIPDTGLFVTLPRRIGVARAKRLLLLSGEAEATVAESWGLVDEVSPVGGAFERAQAVAHGMAALSPAAISGVKRIFAMGAADVDEILSAEKFIQSELQVGTDFAEGRAAFRDKRTPVFG
ncbi:enoyl-CoA hydratase/isomerase family protein [Rhodococcus sp. IEGM 1381]|uniref:enoyl-CoA hydratase/isomerase family protein n=1 Tax=Rhodococcus sp. IEGM 1381 TaxID=3047085 RepID=UPI0024B6C19C|nr:enoyl-CoA hydratase/isomerase family protein [Rhodococcus sp. IEGM 1381]MDI9894443.1 enoyl-CoA hydratase/isomerase family protein [Rhodococcus sp. IEGM 1381]